MVKIYKQPFAHDGDTISIPDASQPDGNMSSADGWTPDYQLPKTDPNYKPVGRQEMNGVFKEVTEALGQVQVQGAATWSPDGAPYPINAQVYHSGKQWLARRANSVAPVEGADWTELVGKKYVDDSIPDLAGVLQPSMTGSATLNGATNNTVQLTGIVTTLALEVGDVIRIQYSGYDKLHTVEYINNNNSVRVNYEHAGNRGNGSLKLANTTASATVTRIAKWYNAPIGLGQAWLDVTGSRAFDATYSNTTGRIISVKVVSISGSEGGRSATQLYVDGVYIDSSFVAPDSSSRNVRANVGAAVPAGCSYTASSPEDARLYIWTELR